MAQSAPINLQVYDAGADYALNLCSPPAGIPPDWYDWELSEDGGNTWIPYYHHSLSTAKFVTGLTPGSTNNKVQVRAVSVVNGTSAFVQTPLIAPPAYTTNFKLEVSKRSIASNATSGTVVFSVGVNMTGTVTWSLVASNTNFGALPMTITSTGANTANVTLTANFPATGGFNGSLGALGYNSLAIRATNGTSNHGEVVWLFAFDPAASNTITNDIVFNANYTGSTHSVTIPSNLPLGTPIGQFNGAAGAGILWPGRGGSLNLDVASLYLEIASTAAYAYGFEVEHNQQDGATLLYANTTAAGSYTVTVGVGVSGGSWVSPTPIATGEIKPFTRTLTVNVEAPAVGATISLTPAPVTNDSAPGTVIGTPGLSGLTGTIAWSMCPEFSNRAEQFSINPTTGTITTTKNLAAGAYAIFVIASNGTNAVWAKFWVVVAWATPSTSDAAFNSGTVTIGIGQTYPSLSSIANKAFAASSGGVPSNPYSGYQWNVLAGTYANDDTYQNGTTGLWQGYIRIPLRIVGQVGSGGAMPLLTCDLGWPSVFNNITDNNSKSNLDVSSTDFSVRGLAVQGFQLGATELFGITMEAVYSAGNLSVGDCWLSNNDTNIINGYEGHRLELCRVIVATGGCNFVELEQTHNLYPNQYDVAETSYLLSRNVTQGHLFKNRAFLGCIFNSRFLDMEGCKSYTIDIPFGGIWYLDGNFLHQGINASNYTMLQFNEEVRVRRWKHKLVVNNNTWRNDNPNVSSIGWNALSTNLVEGPMPDVIFTNNTYYGLPTTQFNGGFIQQTGGNVNSLIQTNNVSTTICPAFDTSSPITSGAVPPADLPPMLPDHVGIPTAGYAWDIYLGSEDWNMAYNAPAGTVLATPFVGGGLGKNLSGGYIYINANAGDTAINIITQDPIPHVGATLTPQGFLFTASGLAAGTKITSVAGGSSGNQVSISPPVANSITAPACYSFPSPYGTNPTFTWTDNLNAFQIVGGQLVKTGNAQTSNTVAVGTMTLVAPAGVTLVNGQPLQNITKQYVIRLTQPPRTNFTVSNGKILDLNGNPWFMRGIAIVDIFQTFNTNMANLILTSFPGINAVRLSSYNMNPPTFYDAVVDVLTSAGVVCIIEDHNTNDTVLTGAALTVESNWYSSLAQHFLSNPYVWFATMNEPGWNSCGPNAQGQDEVPQIIATYNAIRGTGNNTIIAFEAGCGAGAPNPIVDMTNLTWAEQCTSVIWDMHFYAWMPAEQFGIQTNSATQAQTDQTWASMIGLIQQVKSADGIMPVCSIEYGNSTVGAVPDPSGPFIVNTINNPSSASFGGCAWTWYYNETNVPADQLFDVNNNITVYGTQVAAFIAQNATPTISINAIPQETAGSGFTISGSLFNYSAVPGLQYSDDSTGTWFPLPTGSVVSQTSFKFFHPAGLASGSHTVSVRDQATHTIVATSNFFTVVAPVNTITLGVIGSQTTNTPFTITGAMAGYSTIPSLQYQDDTTGNWINLPTGSTITTSSFTFVHPTGLAAGNHIVSVRDANQVTVLGTSNSFPVSAPSKGIIINTILTQQLGQPITVIGSLFGYTAAPSLLYLVDSGTNFQPLPSNAVVTATSFSFTIVGGLSAGAHTISIEDPAIQAISATWSPMNQSGVIHLSNGNETAAASGSGGVVRGTGSIPQSAAAYLEFTLSGTSPDFAVGMGTATSFNQSVVFGIAGSIFDSNGVVWAINSSGQITINSVADTTTSGAIELAYVGGLVWYENSSNAWFKNTTGASGGWVSGSNPL